MPTNVLAKYDTRGVGRTNLQRNMSCESLAAMRALPVDILVKWSPAPPPFFSFSFLGFFPNGPLRPMRALPVDILVKWSPAPPPLFFFFLFGIFP